MTNSLLDLSSVNMNVFQSLWASFSYSEELESHLTLKIFLIVTTLCFWKLWFIDFLLYFSDFETGIERLA